MISIIVSSYREEDFLKLEASIKATLGIPYELVKIENHNQFSLSEAYNRGAQNSRFDLLLFVHEDVTFDSQDWGGVLHGLFAKNPKLGLVGVAGALKKSALPTGWGTGTALFDRIHMIQSDGLKSSLHSTKIKDESSESVKVIDGVFLATTRKIWEEIRFDESLSGYHIYDIDFSLRITQKYLGLVSYEILLTHFSMGNYNSEWVKMTLDYHRKSKNLGLFDRDASYVSPSRRAWYKALTFGDISPELRSAYLREMGYDFLSAVHAFSFRYPVLGRRIFGLLSLVGL